MITQHRRKQANQSLEHCFRSFFFTDLSKEVISISVEFKMYRVYENYENKDLIKMNSLWMMIFSTVEKKCCKAKMHK